MGSNHCRHKPADLQSAPFGPQASADDLSQKTEYYRERLAKRPLPHVKLYS